jgi:hypothetical protein
MTQWSYGEGMTEELDCMLSLIETWNEARRELIVTQHFFCDGSISQPRDELGRDSLDITCTYSVAEAHDSIDKIEWDLRFNEHNIWKHVSEVEEGVLAVEEDKSSHYHFTIHLQSVPYLQALVDAQDIPLHVPSVSDKVLLIHEEGSRYIHNHPTFTEGFSKTFKSFLVIRSRLLQIYNKCNLARSGVGNERILAQGKKECTQLSVKSIYSSCQVTFNTILMCSYNENAKNIAREPFGSQRHSKLQDDLPVGVL